MARTISSSSELKVGDKVYMFTLDFPAVVTDPYGYDGTVEVRDDNGTTQYITSRRLLKAAPYEVGVSYIDADGEIFTFTRDADDDAWTRNNGDTRGFRYPSRPLRKIEFGPELTD